MSAPFARCDGALWAEGVPLAALAAAHGTPCYVYSRAAIEANWHAFARALAGLPHRICYAVKANSNLAVLDVLARLGSGFDIVSAGELARVIAAGGEPAKVVFSGVGKRPEEMAYALAQGVDSFNVESEAEIERLAEVAAAHGTRARVSLRVNPDVDAGTHPYISTGLKENKFGIAHDRARAAYRRAASLASLDVHGIDCHIGSQLTEIAPYLDAARRLLALVDQLAEDGIAIDTLDLGGGQGIRYRDERPLDLQQWRAALAPLLAGRDLCLTVEPGRAVVGDAGLLLTRVEYLKCNGDRHFAVVDAAMNDLLRPALYSAWQAIEAVAPSAAAPRVYDVVGPVCESADFLGKGRELAIATGELLAVRSAGAYCATMSSNYNSRPLTAEVMVDGEHHQLVRRRQGLEELYALESVLAAAP